MLFGGFLMILGLYWLLKWEMFMLILIRYCVMFWLMFKILSKKIIKKIYCIIVEVRYIFVKYLKDKKLYINFWNLINSYFLK